MANRRLFALDSQNTTALPQVIVFLAYLLLIYLRGVPHQYLEVLADQRTLTKLGNIKRID